MKVLHIIDRLDIGGAERAFLDLTKLLLDNNVYVDTLCISAKGELYDTIDNRAKKFYLKRKNKFSLFKLLKCAKFCSKYDIVHVHMRHTYAYVKLAQLISFSTFKILFHDQFGDIQLNKKVPFTMRFLMKPTYYIGVSNMLKNWSIEHLKINPTNSWVLKNTVIPQHQSEIVERTKDWVVVSNVRSTKNIEFAIILSEMCSKSLDVIGQKGKDDYSKRIELEISKSNKCLLLDNISNVQPYLSEYKMALHTSKSESGPIVLMEYMANGLTFLAHKTGEVADVLYDLLPECFVLDLDQSNWINAIKNLEEFPPSDEKLKNLFKIHFGPEKYVEQCLKIYQHIVSF